MYPTKNPTRRLTAQKAAMIKKMALEGDLYQDQIAAALDLNQGRVSEVLAGLRYPDVAPAA